MPAEGKQAGARAGRPGQSKARTVRRAGRSDERVVRSRVSEIQRARMLHAMAEVAAERGAANATVAHVVARSGVSRRTFYDLFEDREDCFMAAFEDALEKVSQRALAAYAQAGRWRERVRGALTAVLGFVEEEPDLGGLLVVESLVAGPRAMARRERVVEVLVGVVEEGREQGKMSHDPSVLSAEGLVGAVLSVVHARIVHKQTGSLTELVNPLMSMIVLPYLGPAAARRESERAVPRSLGRARGRRRDPLRDLDMRLTYRTVRVLIAISTEPGASNRRVADTAGISDQGQISKLLLRLQNLGLIENNGDGPAKGEPNAWRLTAKGEEVEQTIREQTATSEG
jgi:AcrR family transcriptional regulator/DNA-binding MarR family transcriptional regulator